MSSLPSEVTPYSFRGLIELDHSNSIPGIPRHSRYWVDFTLNGAVLDTDHFVEEDAIKNANGVHGISIAGLYSTPFLYLRFTADPSGPATPDLSGMNCDDGDTSGSGAIGRNAEPPPPISPHNVPYCDAAPSLTEHLNLSIRDLTPSALFRSLYFNFHKSWLCEPDLAKRQLLLDTGASGVDFSFENLFISGPATLADSRSYRTPNLAVLRDGVFIDGPGGSVASSRFLSLAYVPPVPAPLPLVKAASALAWSRRLRGRIRQNRQARQRI